MGLSAGSLCAGVLIHDAKKFSEKNKNFQFTGPKTRVVLNFFMTLTTTYIIAKDKFM